MFICFLCVSQVGQHWFCVCIMVWRSLCNVLRLMARTMRVQFHVTSLNVSPGLQWFNAYV